MRLLDIVLLIPLAWGGYRGFKRGMILEIFSLSALVLATLGSTRLLDGALALGAKWHYELSGIGRYVVFVLLFITILVATVWVGKLCQALLKPTLLGTLDRLLGSVVGILKWGILSSVCLWLGNLVQLQLPEQYTAGTFLFPVIKALAPRLLTWCGAWLPHLQDWAPANDARPL